MALDNNDILKKELRGGARKGAGRKALRGETVVKRFPERYVSAINALIEHLDNTRGKAGAGGYNSEVKCRNLNGTLISLRFQSNSNKSEM